MQKLVINCSTGQETYAPLSRDEINATKKLADMVEAAQQAEEHRARTRVKALEKFKSAKSSDEKIAALSDFIAAGGLD